MLNYIYVIRGIKYILLEIFEALYKSKTAYCVAITKYQLPDSNEILVLVELQHNFLEM